MPKVSIIMPSLNVGPYIGEAIESARNQTLKDIEIICVDAGSTDGTREIIEDKATKDDRIRVIDSPVKSYGHQVNLGFEVAKGEYIAILETDDFIDSKMYEKLAKVADESKLDYVKSDYDAYITDEGKRCFIRRRLSDNKGFYGKVFSPIDYPQIVADDSYLWNGIYSRSFLCGNGIKLSETSGAAFQDIGFLHKVKAYAKRATYIEDSFYRYCTDREGASSNSGKSLRFIRQEYGFLLDELNSMSKKEQTLLFIRMARAYARAAMESSIEYLRSLEGKEICEWLRAHMIDAMAEKLVCEEDLPVSLKVTFNYLIESVDSYIGFRENRIDELKKFLGEGNPIVIFGAGIYGREAEKFLREIGTHADYFMDNASSLWGTRINGIVVVQPDLIVGMSKETRIIIANEKYSYEIKEQIEDNRRGLNIYIY